MAGAPLSRRAFLGSTLAVGAIAITPRALRSPLLIGQGATAVPAEPFTLGIASGDPRPTGVVLWTRLAPDPLAPGGGMPPDPVRVRWEVATDERFADVVRRGSARASADAAHSVHVDVDGLAPARDYFYRFLAGDEESPVGRTRTAPAADAEPKALRLAFASCQDYEEGLFVAYRHLTDEDLDVVLFLGDYMYERPTSTGRARAHEGPEPMDLDGYRRRYATYKADADLQAAHAAHPWVVTWDDHEVEDNYAGGFPKGQEAGPVAEFVTRRTAAYRAWWEHQPVRLGPPPASGDYRIHRRVPFGGLAEIFVLDTRQYRTNQPCAGATVSDIGAPCAGVDAPDATLLGAQQERWLTKALRASGARWNALAQQVLFAQANFAPGAGDGLFDLDAWDGYRVERARLLETLGTVDNPVVLTGDVHSAWVNDITADFDDPTAPVIGSEIIGTSVTSFFPYADIVTDVIGSQSHLKYFEGRRHGYVRCTVDPKEWRADHRYVSDIQDPAATIETGASFVLEAGNPGAQPA